MYTQFYGLREKPFSLSPDPRYLFLADSHREALAHLLYGIEQGEGFIAITGEVGTGKTTLCRTLLQRIEPGTEVSFIFNPQLSPLELLQGICAELGLDARSESRRELTERLNHFLVEKKAEGRRVLLIIDEAQNLAAETLEQIRLLSNLETDTSKLVQIILIGQPELDALLESHQLRQLRQRISVRWRLKPLSANETRDYVRHRLRIAAGAPRELFSELALREVHRRSRGVPRVVNLLCDRALLAGYAAGARSIGLGIVTQTDREIRGGSELSRFRESAVASTRWRRALPIAAVLLAALAGGYAWQALRGPGSPLSPVAAAPPAPPVPIPAPAATRPDAGSPVVAIAPAPPTRTVETRASSDGAVAQPRAATDTAVAQPGAAASPAAALTPPQRSGLASDTPAPRVAGGGNSQVASADAPVVLDPAAVTMAPSAAPIAITSSEPPNARASRPLTSATPSSAIPAARTSVAPAASAPLAGATPIPGRRVAPSATPRIASARPGTPGTTSVAAPAPVSARPPRETGRNAIAASSEDLATALARTAPAAATAAAFDALLTRWQAKPRGAELLSVDEALAALSDHSLHALPLRGARVSTLKHFDRPALVVLRARDGGERVVLLEALEPGGVRLAGTGGAASRRVPLDQFEAGWTGDAWVVWRDFESLPALLRSGQRGAPVAWLQHSLGQLGYYKQPTTGEYDAHTFEAVQAFQASRRLRADGAVGPVTKIALYDALGRYAAPQLTPGGKRG